MSKRIWLKTVLAICICKKGKSWKTWHNISAEKFGKKVNEALCIYRKNLFKNEPSDNWIFRGNFMSPLIHLTIISEKHWRH